jgi:hypothetical protein
MVSLMKHISPSLIANTSEILRSVIRQTTLYGGQHYLASRLVCKVAIRHCTVVFTHVDLQVKNANIFVLSC